MLVLLDLSAAFDSIDHHVLLARLHSRFGISGKALAWIQNYLSNRTQSVIIKNSMSKKWNLQFGVPQGSVLGPILFTLYMSPLGDIIKSHGINYHCYADDTQLYLSFNPKDFDTARKRIEECISDIRSWMASSFLCLNDSKTEFIVFGSKNSLSHLLSASLKIGKSEVSKVSEVRNLGSTLDESLSMQKQINNTCKGAWMCLRRIGQIRQFLDKATAEKLVHAYISSKLDFMNALLYSLPSNHLDKLTRVQNAAARLVTRTKKFDHITPVLVQLHWLPIAQRIEFKILLLVYKCLHNLAPSYLSALIVPVSSQRALRSSSKNLLTVQKSRTIRYGDGAFCNAGPQLWNKLPENVKDSASVDIFKSKLKTCLFNKAYGQ